jgi:hypothetical protein
MKESIDVINAGSTVGLSLAALMLLECDYVFHWTINGTKNCPRDRSPLSDLIMILARQPTTEFSNGGVGSGSCFIQDFCVSMRDITASSSTGM